MYAGGRVFGSVLLLLTIGGGAAVAQSADLMMSVSGQATLRLGDAAALVGVVGGSLSAQTDPAKAADLLRSIGFALPSKSSDEPITVGEYCYLVIQLLDLPTGMLYSIFPGPRYALREIVARGLLPADVYPGARMSGNEALRILGSLARAGG